MDNARWVARSGDRRFFTDGARSQRRIDDVGKRQKKGRVYDQASAIPFRRRDGDLEFCLITSMSKRQWCFPKGIIDPGETPAETALKEAAEEAGLRGCIVGDALGEYEYGKWGRVLRVVVLLMEVHHADDDWPEAEHRQRRGWERRRRPNASSRRGSTRSSTQSCDDSGRPTSGAGRERAR